MNRNFEKTQFIMAVSAGDDAVMYPAGRMLSMQHEQRVQIEKLTQLILLFQMKRKEL